MKTFVAIPIASDSVSKLTNAIGQRVHERPPPILAGRTGPNHPQCLPALHRFSAGIAVAGPMPHTWITTSPSFAPS